MEAPPEKRLRRAAEDPAATQGVMAKAEDSAADKDALVKADSEVPDMAMQLKAKKLADEEDEEQEAWDPEPLESKVPEKAEEAETGLQEQPMGVAKDDEIELDGPPGVELGGLPGGPPPASALVAAVRLASTARLGGAASRRILVVGELRGRLDMLHVLLNRLVARGELPDFVLATGRFFSDAQDTGVVGDYVGAAPRLRLPAPVYFVDSASRIFIAKAAASGKEVRLSREITFLGACGVTDILGLRVAFLSGRYDEEAFESVWGEAPFEKEHYTAQAITEIRRQVIAQSRHVDILLTSEMPDLEWSQPLGRLVPPLAGPGMASPAVRQLLFALRPRYHFCGGSRYQYRKAERQGPGGCFLGSSLQLAEASMDADPEDCLRRWWRMLHITPAPLKSRSGPVYVEAQPRCRWRAPVRAPEGLRGLSLNARGEVVNIDIDGPPSGVAAGGARPSGRSRPGGRDADRGPLRSASPSPDVVLLEERSRVRPLRSLRAGWEARWSRTHNRAYYKHTATGQKTWRFPAAAADRPPRARGGAAQGPGVRARGLKASSRRAAGLGQAAKAPGA